MNKVVIAGACRTAIGTMGGALSSVPAVNLGAVVIKEAIRRAGIQPEQVEEVFMGNALQAGNRPNPARQAAIFAGLPVEVTATTVNVLCGSGLHSINLAAKMIAMGDKDIAVAGGFENMSQAPYLVKNGRYGYRMGAGKLEDAMLYDALEDAFYDYHMGVTAENVAERWKLSREELDEFAAWSQRKCEAAQAEGRFRDEIVPIEVKTKKGVITVQDDEGPRKGVTAESISGLRPAFKKDGVVTAANSSGINDGAAAVVLMSEKKAKELGILPMAYWIYGDLAGVDPQIMGIGPIAATKRVFDKTGITVEELDLIEANEAFAAQSLAVARELNFDMDKVNVNGGAIALGHPLGGSGARIFVTLLYEMMKRDVRTGLATLCIGGGMGCAAIIKR